MSKRVEERVEAQDEIYRRYDAGELKTDDLYRLLCASKARDASGDIKGDMPSPKAFLSWIARKFEQK